MGSDGFQGIRLSLAPLPWQSSWQRAERDPRGVTLRREAILAS